MRVHCDILYSPNAQWAVFERIFPVHEARSASVRAIGPLALPGFGLAFSLITSVGTATGRDLIDHGTAGSTGGALREALNQEVQLQAWLAGALGTAAGGPASYGGAAAHGAHASAAYAAVSNSRTKRRQAGAAPLAVPGATGAAYSAHGAGSDDAAAAMSALAGGVGGVLAELREGHSAVRREMAALKAAVVANATQHAEILQVLRSLAGAQG